MNWNFVHFRIIKHMMIKANDSFEMNKTAAGFFIFYLSEFMYYNLSSMIVFCLLRTRLQRFNTDESSTPLSTIQVLFKYNCTPLNLNTKNYTTRFIVQFVVYKFSFKKDACSIIAIKTLLTTTKNRAKKTTLGLQS